MSGTLDVADRQVLLVRGLPGSGKSTFIKTLPVALVCSPDLYFYQSGTYHFDKHKIGHAHSFCRVAFAKGLYEGLSPIVLDYPFIERWQYEDYEWTARLAGYELSIIEMVHSEELLPLFAERNVHGVPLSIIKGMAKKWVADPRGRLEEGF